MKDSTPEQTGAFEHPYDPPCDGSSECKALIHLHGCFSDKGHCDAPQEHSSGADGKPTEDELDAALVAERDAADTGERIALDDLIREHGFEPEDFDA